jgi:hypothetical protein
MRSNLLRCFLIPAISLFLCIPDGQAIPAFARKYNTSCSTCHYAFPMLNSFGKAFKNNGYRFPGGQDPDMIKEQPVSLGAEAYKKVWPKAVWPTDMAGAVPVSVRPLAQIHYDNAVQGKKSTYFEVPAGISLLFAGTFDTRFSYFGAVELQQAADLSYFFGISYNFLPALNLKLGSVGLDEVSPQNRPLGIQDYNVAVLENQSGTWSLDAGAGGGAELWGAINGPGGKGGFTYSAGVGNGQSDLRNFDLNKQKDYYGRVTYKFGGIGVAGGSAGQSTVPSTYYKDNSFQLGGFAYSGKAISDSLQDDKFSIIGGEIDWWFDRLNVNAVALQMKSDYLNIKRSSFAYYVEGNYMIYPWLIGRARYEYADADINSDAIAPARNILPGVVILLRANVKLSLEYLKPLDKQRRHDDGFYLQLDFGL